MIYSTLTVLCVVRAAYDLDEHANLTLTVYDCNQPFNDNATIELNIADPTHTIDISATSITAGAGVTLRGIFRSDYGACDPSAKLLFISRRKLQKPGACKRHRPPAQYAGVHIRLVTISDSDAEQ